MIILSAVALYLGPKYFFDQLNIRLQGNPLAKMRSRQNIVRLKRSFSIDWEKVEGTENLYTNDVVFNPDQNSKSSIEFSGGSIFHLGPKSMVSITQEKEVDLLSGFAFVDVNNKGGLTVNSGVDKIILKGKDAKIKLVSSKNGIDFKLITGNAKLSINGKVKELVKNKPFNQRMLHKKRKKTKKVSLLSPINNKSFKLKEDEIRNVRLKWKTNITPCDLNVSNNQDFSESENYTEIYTNYQNINASMQGKYYWKVKCGKKKVVRTSKTAIFSIVKPIKKETIVLEKPEIENSYSVRLRR
ncbi:MAG: hypothetical protein HOE90_04165 [Bacteriovoracaceae bacterium]|nr:hypothetical protein [Bacteriovoracaceae bacterium]